MWSSLFGDFTQPVAVVPSVGAVDAALLGKLLVLAILKIEEAGGKILAVVCDGASPNKKMFKNMDVEGKCDKNYEEAKSIFDDLDIGIQNTLNKTPIKYTFTNPYDENREIYVISDPPHLLKGIRNNLMKQENFQVYKILITYFIN